MPDHAVPATPAPSACQVDGDLRASVILPHLNTPELLVRALQSVAAQRLDHGAFEIIVVDNGSRMPLDAVAASWPDVRFLVEPEPGPGPARNLGVAHARGRVLAFVDADIRVAPDWLLTGVRAVEADPDRPVGGDVRIDFHDPRRPNAIEAFEAVFSFRQKMYINRRGFSGSGNLMVDRELFRKVGGFGPINTAEDRQWGLKARAMGHPTRYLPEMRVYHPPRGSREDVEARWARLIAHQFDEHQAKGRSPFRWKMQALAVLLSAVAQAPVVLFSERVPTAGGRVRGLTFLFQNRCYRFMEMHRIAGNRDAGGAESWNRTS
ncbi:MAG: glycosyltransferase [Sphingomonadaceae bacterium]